MGGDEERDPWPAPPFVGFGLEDGIIDHALTTTIPRMFPMDAPVTDDIVGGGGTMAGGDEEEFP